MAENGYRGHAEAAVDELQRWYARRTGLWKTTGWWNAANALTAVIRYTEHTGDRSHEHVIERTFRQAPHRNSGFVNKFFDDNFWWALAWADAYDLTGESRYLDAAKAIFAHNLSGWDDTCRGGLWWNEDRKYKNAITNELLLTLAARLHQRTQGSREGAPGEEYLTWALRSWEWLYGSGMIGPSGLVNDGLTAACANNGGPTWTYNQGVILGGLAALHAITGDAAYLRQGETIADATLATLTIPPGILAEPTELAEVQGPGTGGRALDGDQTQFKGIFARYLHDFSRSPGLPADKSATYRAFILANADSVWSNAGNERHQFGARWGGPFDTADASRQSSALEVLTSAAALA
jgi:predicted alpha-1,6-mannanase (GH76 family)